MFKSFSIFFIMLMLFGNSLQAVPKKPVVPVVHYSIKMDTTKIVPGAFSKVAIKKYNEDADFNYTVVKTNPNWWDRFWTWVWQVWYNFWHWIGELLRRLFGKVPGVKNPIPVFKTIILCIAAFMLVYIIVKMAGLDLLKLFRKKKSIESIPYSESIENIHEISFDDSIENALALKNYRLAVRLLYLRCLKQLSDKNLITWKLEKTNSAYLNELTDTEQRRRFAVVTKQFEYVWYGDFPVDGQSFVTINDIFQDFKNHLP